MGLQRVRQDREAFNFTFYMCLDNLDEEDKFVEKYKLP